jgi:hypothetical protein
METTYGATRRRHLESVHVERLSESGNYLFVDAKGSGFGCPLDRLTRRPEVGKDYEVETCNGSLVTGLRDSYGWLFRKSDQDMDEDHRKMVEGFDRKDRERLDAHREEWAAREAALPPWAQERLARFRAAGGEKFDLKGWAYELIVCELAALYAAGDQAGVDSLAQREGTSGNQHDCAEALAKWLVADADLNRFPAALAPLTGSADYSDA